MKLSKIIILFLIFSQLSLEFVEARKIQLDKLSYEEVDRFIRKNKDKVFQIWNENMNFMGITPEYIKIEQHFKINLKTTPTSNNYICGISTTFEIKENGKYWAILSYGMYSFNFSWFDIAQYSFIETEIINNDELKGLRITIHDKQGIELSLDPSIIATIGAYNVPDKQPIIISNGSLYCIFDTGYLVLYHSGDNGYTWSEKTQIFNNSIAVLEESYDLVTNDNDEIILICESYTPDQKLFYQKYFPNNNSLSSIERVGQKITGLTSRNFVQTHACIDENNKAWYSYVLYGYNTSISKYRFYVDLWRRESANNYTMLKRFTVTDGNLSYRGYRTVDFSLLNSSYYALSMDEYIIVVDHLIYLFNDGVEYYSRNPYEPRETQDIIIDDNGIIHGVLEVSNYLRYWNYSIPDGFQVIDLEPYTIDPFDHDYYYCRLVLENSDKTLWFTILSLNTTQDGGYWNLEVLRKNKENYTNIYYIDGNSTYDIDYVSSYKDEIRFQHKIAITYFDNYNNDWYIFTPLINTTIYVPPIPQIPLTFVGSSIILLVLGFIIGSGVILKRE